MTTREKALEIAKDMIKHLKELKKLRDKNFQLGRDNEAELTLLLATDDEIIKLYSKIEKLTKEIDF
ncbi:hypothetical protein QIU18_00470 [Capnocytophaga canimorsus]|uniref:hypothetical protein n=1 Tax=Capnocytophaga canis TaxID=1848903 RepID=UPI00249B1CEB|nr:hypothetical protein [Capnocytophaga canimorsus]WGU68231.1 hypothetical protein QIU19_13350 [Capnocytophaga canimorsus]WGU70665.1 hypothetical protein QIU18_00470 [Capnocytophaga canimorsus]